MLEELFRNGTLEMSASPVAGLAADLRWIDLLPNRILALVSVTLLVLSLRDLFLLIPHLLYCYDRPRGAEALEHSLGMARLRNGLAIAYILPFGLILDRFAVLRPAFWDAIPPAWSAAATVWLVSAYALVRTICYLLFRPRRLGAEAAATLHHNLYNYLFLALPLMLLLTLVWTMGQLPEALAGTVLRWILAIVWAFGILRSGQILRAYRSGLSTFLYLCALEFLPAALLVAVVVYF